MEKFLYADASRTYYECVLGIELLFEKCQSFVGRSSSAFHFNVNRFVSSGDDEINLVGSVSPIEYFVILIVGVVDEVRANC